MFQKDLRLTDLVNLEEWQKIQDSFSEVLEVTLRTIALDGGLLTKISRPNRLSAEILPKLPNANKFCGDCTLKEGRTRSNINIKKDVKFKCPLGLNVFIVPIGAIGNQTVAYIIVGPLILKARKSISEYAKDAEKLEVKLEELMDVLIEINVFSYNKVYSIINLIKDIFSYMSQTGYHKKRLGEIAPEVVKMDPLFSRYYEEKILSALLHSCALALNADSGSVMTVDSKTNILHIKVATKLDNGIINRANVKVGEGIAGVAAATGEPIILPKDKNKNGISEKMKRRYIKSSMIVPFNKGNTHDVYGVINLNIVRKTVDFSEKDIALVKELVNMASAALLPFQTSSRE